jgi:tetratricopeptide (TPR) repeat protein
MYAIFMSALISFGIPSTARADTPTKTKAASTASPSKDKTTSLETSSQIKTSAANKPGQTKTVTTKTPPLNNSATAKTRNADSISDTQSDSEYFRFAGPAKFNDYVLAGAKRDYQVWKPKEVKKISDFMHFVSNKYPGLMRRASAEAPIALFRSSSLGEAPKPVKERTPDEDWVCLAATSNGAISFADIFFSYNDDRGKQMTTHELVHAADIGDSIAYSPEWVSFVKRNSIKLNKCEYMYGEALANTFADYAVGKPIPDADRFKNEIVNRLCTDTEASKTYRALIGKGLKFNTQKKYTDAINCFEKAGKQLTSVPTPYLLSTVDFYRLQKRKEALEQSALAQKLIDANGVQIGEQRLQLFFYLRALLLASEVGDYKGAIKLVDRILIENGDHSKAKELKAFCLEKLNAKP